ncbi:MULTISPECIES: hypothetical protein [Streptomyces]|uniref:Uncharacterized protein n=1 Tax=Streptomyces rimosus subsp. rimosus (strain ATCC 10970 / DSM 40260 / JCM 4667 / NRRL 2234) TaxID=1265868 RepID=L8ENC7_STRR1|nr:MULTISPECIES: hypothetical protein [Streptomyces]KOG76825.1 hypothetical protein ADK78_09815 [Kitasatospora aureofaciens]MYT45015.1 hypothetical protein [Streptomyces sp. SID5471]KEF07372.1 hypothetical protein DF17_10760 [Streptomyces rimosus]KEF19692.1 hypothetical protein DF18_16640 [Streptomyces rimosus]KOT33762.1 hypothetical protein ADK42_23340 [Streptomyces rimosus subsp. rimosus]
MEEIVCRRPGAGSAGYLRDCSGYRERLAGALRRREVPSSRVTLVIAFGDPVVVPPSRSGRHGGGPRASLVSELHDRLLDW